jgi:hypothetical protein
LSSSNELTKNDKAWMQLFEKHNILDRINNYGQFEITSNQINEFREARLMTKFDHRINLPKLFLKDDLSILPVTRGSYIISKFDAYRNFEQTNDEIIMAKFPEYIQSIDHENITSEAMAINCAYASNILADFLDDEELMPTVNGRMGSDCFSFNILNTHTNSDMSIKVANSQIEIDGGYEGLNQLAIIEAKNFVSEDFLIRQLYYPYRLWSGKVTKKITPVFLVYTNGVFSLFEYKFCEPYNYNSLILIKQKNYSIDAVAISLDDIIKVLRQVSHISEPEIPFPQANSFKRVISLCELLSQNEMTKEDITSNYAFDPRQTNYYTDAGRYLGLIDKTREDDKIVFSLTSSGREIFCSKYKPRQIKLVEAILKHRVFAKSLQLYLNNLQTPTIKEITVIMKECNLFNIESDETFMRRASTVTGWLNWIIELQR